LVIDWIVKSGRCQYGITLPDGRLKRKVVAVGETVMVIKIYIIWNKYTDKPGKL